MSRRDDIVPADWFLETGHPIEDVRITESSDSGQTGHSESTHETSRGEGS